MRLFTPSRFLVFQGFLGLRGRWSAWMPKKRLTWAEIDRLRDLKTSQPNYWTVGKLSKLFSVSESAVLRILKSKFVPADDVRRRQDKKAWEKN
eukprot:m.21139 g.21139  ORF g.21139 m.21139 type:complete len:93 (+) comp28141_c0_seq1:2-280(+)